MANLDTGEVPLARDLPEGCGGDGKSLRRLSGAEQEPGQAGGQVVVEMLV